MWLEDWGSETSHISCGVKQGSELNSTMYSMIQSRRRKEVSVKTLDTNLQQVSLVGCTLCIDAEWCAMKVMHTWGWWKLLIWSPPILYLMCPFYDFFLNCFLIINVAFPWILWVDLLNYQAWVSPQGPLSSRQLVRSEGGPRDPELVTGT